MVGTDDLRSPLEQTGVQVEDITRISFTSGRATEQERDLPISDGLFGEVVEDHERGASGVPEIFADSGTSEGCVELHRSGIGCVRGHDGRVVHRSVLFETTGHTCNGRGLLPDGYVDAVDRIPFFVEFLLIDDRIDGHRGLTGLTVPDDQFALAPSDRDHRIDRLDPGL